MPLRLGGSCSHHVAAGTRSSARNCTLRCGVDGLADIRQGTLTDAKLCAYGANQAHGLRRTNEDKAKATEGMLRDFPTWGDGNIARHIGVASMTVMRHRKLLEQMAI